MTDPKEEESDKKINQFPDEFNLLEKQQATNQFVVVVVVEVVLIVVVVEVERQEFVVVQA